MKAEPPPTRDVNRDSGTASANGGWLRRLVRRHLFLSRPLKQSYDEPRPKRLRSIKYADVSGYMRPENGVERIATMRTLGWISMKLGRKLSWDPVKEVFAGDDEANAMRSRPQRAPYGINRLLKKT